MLITAHDIEGATTSRVRTSTTANRRTYSVIALESKWRYYAYSVIEWNDTWNRTCRSRALTAEGRHCTKCFTGKGRH